MKQNWPLVVWAIKYVLGASLVLALFGAFARWNRWSKPLFYYWLAVLIVFAGIYLTVFILNLSHS
jgi:hypothetical protein